MAYLNTQQRESLRQELLKLKFNQAKGRLRRLDAKGRLAFLRNSQMIGVLYTDYVLPTMGVRVTLVEHETELVNRTDNAGSTPTLMASTTEFIDVLVNALPEKQT